MNFKPSECIPVAAVCAICWKMAQYKRPKIYILVHLDLRRDFKIQTADISALIIGDNFFEKF